MNSSKRKAFIVFSIVLPAFITAGVAWFCINRLNQYGLTLFVGTPTFLGVISAAFLRLAGPHRLLACVGVAWLSGCTLFLIFLAFAWEGFICLLMAAPLGAPLIALGAAIGFLAFHRAGLKAIPTASALFVLIVLSSIIESRVERVAPVYLRTDSMVVNASANQVWDTIVGLETLPQPDDWFLRTGVACPRSARVVRPGAGGERVCTLSTGEYVEAIEVWRPASRIRWRALSTPPPLKEINPFHEDVDPPHLHGYYEATSGEIVIDQLSASSVNVTRKTWYKHNLYPATYWKQWCDLGAWRAHVFVLKEWKAEAERTSKDDSQNRGGV